jgi:hypothetical protein
VLPSAPGAAPMLAIARSSVSCGTVIHEYLMLGIIASCRACCRSDPRRLACIALNALGLRHFGNNAGSHRRGAFPEPDRLCAPMLPSTAKKTVDVQTCKGFATVAASFATGPALRAFGAIRGGASRAQPARLRAEVLRASSVATSAIENGRFAHALSAEVPLRPDTRFQPSLTTGRWHFLYLVNGLRDS